MSDIKSVIALLCKHLHLSIDSSIKPEYFRLAKYNKENAEVTEAFWTTLYILGRLAVRDMQLDDEFDRYDDVHSTKLCFAFMQYPVTEFYGLSANDNNVCRELLLALGWLLATKNVLNIAVRAKLATSGFGHEFSRTMDPSPIKNESHRSLPIDPRSEMNNIIARCGHVGHNIKEIGELMQEKIKLTTKIHAASMNTSGLPHLSVQEIVLAKKSFDKNRLVGGMEDDRCMRNLNSAGLILETYTRWTKKQHVFYDWMVTVIKEKKEDNDDCSLENQSEELSNFVSLLRHVTKKKLHSMKNKESPLKNKTHFEDPCVSRFLRTQQGGGAETETWIVKTSEELRTVEKDVETKMKKLSTELRKMLKRIGNCVEV